MRSGTWRRWLTPKNIAAASVVALAIGVLALTEFIPTDGPDLASGVWGVEVEGESLLVFLTRVEKLSITLPTRAMPGGNVRDVVEYHLVLARPADGKQLARAEIDAIGSGLNPPRILGIAGDLVWLFSDQLEARALPSLKRHIDADDVRDANPRHADSLADESRFYDFSPGRGGLVVQSTDGQSHLLRPSDLTLLPAGADPEPLEKELGVAADELDLVRGAELAGSAYAMASDFELARMRAAARDPRRFQLSSASGNLSDGEARRVHRGAFDAGTGKPDLEQLVPMGERAFVLGGLLAAPASHGAAVRDAREAWVLPDRPSLLVWSKASLAGSEAWRLARVDTRGEVLWETNTGIVEADRLLAAGSSAVFIGTARPEQGLHRGEDLIVAIHLDTGRRVVVFGATGDDD